MGLGQAGTCDDWTSRLHKHWLHTQYVDRGLSNKACPHAWVLGHDGRSRGASLRSQPYSDAVDQ